MSHRNPKPPRWPQRQSIKLLHALEGLALSALPRGTLRKRLLDRVDQALKQIHVHRCGE
jgi:hypothetical protein